MFSAAHGTNRINYFKKLFLLLILISVAILPLIKVRADDCKNISDSDAKLKCYADQEAKYEKQRNEVLANMGKVSAQIDNLGKDLNLTQGQIDDVQNQIKNITDQLAEINKNLEDRR